MIGAKGPPTMSIQRFLKFLTVLLRKKTKKDFIVPAWGPDNEANYKNLYPPLHDITMSYSKKYENKKKQLGK